MNSHERLFRRLNGEAVDRIPNLCILMSFAAKYANIPFGKFCTHPESMVEANLKCHEDFGIDVVTTMSDPYSETNDFGAEIEFPYDSNPVCRKPLLKEYQDIKLLKVRNIGSSGRMLKRVEAIEIYNRQVKGSCPIIGWVEGAFAEFVDLRGINKAMTDLFDEPDFVREVMEICTEQAILFARAQIKAGADIIGVGDAVASLVGMNLYREMVLVYEKRIIDAIHEAGAKSKLHICGDITPILDCVCESGADIIDVDWMVDFKAASEKLKGKAAANGNFDPVAVLLHGDEDAIKKSVIDCIKMGNSTSIISAGCEVPSGTPHRNLLAVNSTLIECADNYIEGELV